MTTPISDNLRVTVIEDFEHAQLIATQLYQHEILLGFDTETTVPNARQTEEKLEISLIQLSNGNETWLFRMGRIGQMPPTLKRLLTSVVPVKVGIGLDNDFIRLERGYGFRPWGFVDLQLIALSLGHAEVSFDGLCSWVGIASSQALSDLHNKAENTGHHEGNWDLPTLSRRQISYAAYDAQACVTIYRKLFDSFAPVGSHGIFDRLDGPSVQRSTQKGLPSEIDKEQLIRWVQNEIDKSPNHRTLNSLVNQAINSYGPWRTRWITVDRRRLVTETLQEALATNRLQIHEKSRAVSGNIRKPMPLLEPMSLDHWFNDLNLTMRNRVHGLSQKAAVNMMINGYGPWSAYPKEQRHEWATQAYYRFSA